MRIYKTVSEILTGFDVDCSGAAYDGKQVHCTLRALQSYITQINHVDLSRRSSSYENRLSKYPHRGFEICWLDLDRSRINPTMFKRSFPRTIVKILMNKSAANESEEEEKQFRKRNGDLPHSGTSPIKKHEDQDAQDTDIDTVDDGPDEEGRKGVGPESFIKLKKDEEQNTQDGVGPKNNQGDPVFCDVKAVAWDVPGSPMHFAILGGHEDIVKLLCEVSFPSLSFTP